MTESTTYAVPELSCSHCEDAVASALAAVAGVEGVEVDLRTKLVTATGTGLDDAALRGAIDEAGYAVAG